MGVTESKPQNKEKIMKKILVAASMVLLGTMSVNALSLTTAGTDVNNSVSLNYEVSGVSQVQIDANDTGFVVDRKIDISVSNSDTDNQIDVAPGSINQILTFVVHNQGNDQETYDLSMYQHGTGLSDDFDPLSGTCIIYDDAGNSGETLQITLAQEDNMTVTVHCSIPDSVTDDQNATLDLIAAVNGRTKANDDVDDPAVVQDIYADGAGVSGVGDGDDANDGKHSAYGTYHVVTATLSASKVSCVIEDPVHQAGGATEVHAIPGATIRYAIEISNTGSGDANSTVVTDDINTTIYDDATVTNLYIETAACDCAAGGSNAAGGSSGFSSPTVTLDFEDIASGVTKCGYFEVDIQ